LAEPSKLDVRAVPRFVHYFARFWFTPQWLRRVPQESTVSLPFFDAFQGAC